MVPLKSGKIFELSGAEARHILLSRRVAVGETVYLQGPDQKRFEARVILANKGSLSLEVLSEIKTPKESDLGITIFQALIKERSLDFVIQKATELGVKNLVLFNSKNSVARFKDIDKKLKRWRKIGEEATKQSGRTKSVRIEYMDNAESVKMAIRDLDHLFLLEPKSSGRFSTWKPATRELDSQEGFQVTNIGILVGPEGGFTEEEVREFSNIKNLTCVGMGPRILRAETAVIAAAAVIQAFWGDI